MNSNLTQILLNYNPNDPEKVKALFDAIYGELRRLANVYMKRESTGHTLQATALVNEAYLKLVDQKVVEWKNRSHFFGIAAQVMRRILLDHARSKKAEKPGGDAVQVTLSAAGEMAQPADLSELLDIDEALERLATLSHRQAKVVELRFFAGLGINETAEALDLSPATVKREWAVAKAYLQKELSRQL